MGAEQQRRILALALATTEDDAPLPQYEPEEKVIGKVATLFGILEQLGFTKERIEECLRTVKALELEDALDWVSLGACASGDAEADLLSQLFLHCDADELGCDGPIVPLPPVVETPTAPPTPSREPKEAPTPATSSFQSSALDEASVEASLRARILAYAEDQDEENPGEVSVGEAPDANRAYAGLKLQMSEIQRAQGVAKRAQKAKKGGPAQATEQEELMELQVSLLKKKLKVIEGDYTFRKVDAGSWRDHNESGGHVADAGDRRETVPRGANEARRLADPGTPQLDRTRSPRRDHPRRHAADHRAYDQRPFERPFGGRTRRRQQRQCEPYRQQRKRRCERRRQRQVERCRQ